MSSQFRRVLPRAICGCWYILPNQSEKRYLPQVELESHTTILATTSKTRLQQTFVNPLNENLKEVSYTFPLYDGISIAGFECYVADRKIVGIVKERNQARVEYQEAVSKGQTAGLLEQNVDAADVFTTSIGNIPAGEKVVVYITYLGELKNDAETDGARFTIPTNIAPRYGSQSLSLTNAPSGYNNGGIKISIDVMLEEGAGIRGIQSPSHPIAVTVGRTSTASEDDDAYQINHGSATLALGSTELDKDFVVVIQAKGQDTPRALLETHPTLPNQRALMTTLVPKFNIPSQHPEIVFVVDRSGSMGGKMHLVIEAMKVFLKSLPVTVRFNICSFGSRFDTLFPNSVPYSASTLEHAMHHIRPENFQSNYGGTEMLGPVKHVLKQRYKDLALEVMLITDGEIWNQQALFDVVNEASQQKARFFTLGIGSGASSSLVEGIARAGRGFAQFVNDGERIDKRIVRMLKAALTPHIRYTLEVRYACPPSADEDDFEIIESFDKSMQLVAKENNNEAKEKPVKPRGKLSLFDTKAKDEATNPPAGRYDHLPTLSVPHVIQTPYLLPELYPHSRYNVFLLIGPEAYKGTPTSVMLRGVAEGDDLELELPVQDIGQDTTIHQLAAKKAMQELEEGRGWVTAALTPDGKQLKTQHEGKWDLIIEREAVRLGTTFQIGGKFCSFVAIDESEKDQIGASPAVQIQQTSHMDLEQKKRSSKVQFSYSSAIGPQTNVLSVASAPSIPPPGGFSVFGTASSSSASFGGSAQVGYSAAPAPKGGLFGTKNTGSQRTGGGGGLFGSLGLFGSRSPFAQAAQQQQVQEMKGTAEKLDTGAQEISASMPLGSVAPPFSAGPPPPSPFSAKPPPPPLARQGLFGSSTISNSPPQASFNHLSATPQLYDPTVTTQPSYNMVPPPLAPAAEPTTLSKMQTLISLQSFRGTWALTPQVLTILLSSSTQSFAGAWRLGSQSSAPNDIALLVLKPYAESLGVDVEDLELGLDVEDCVTVLVIAWLEVVMGEEEDVWQMVVEKARGALEGKVDGSEVVERLVGGVQGFFKAG